MSVQNAIVATFRLVILLLPPLAMGSGCAAVSPSGPGAELGALAAPLEGPGDLPPVASINVEVRAAGRPPEMRQLPMQSGMHVQDALEQAKLTARFRRMDLRIMRPVNGQLAKLDVKYRHQSQRVDPLFDYALHPGDHLVVIEDTSTILDDMLSGLPLGGGSSRGN